MSAFDTAFTELLGPELEGQAFSSDEHDPGNWTGGKVGVGKLSGTFCGISAATHPDLDIQHLSQPQIKEIYRTEFWEPLKGDVLPGEIAVALFKEAVNLGVSGAVKLLQRSLKLEEDGVMGQITEGTVASNPAIFVLTYFLSECAWHYTQLSGFPHDGRGWLKRVIRTALEAQP